MDEPTAALSETEIDRLLKLVRSLAAAGWAWCTCRTSLGEVFGVADRITVLRDGRHILTAPRANLTEQAVISAMVGRELVHTACPQHHPGEVRAVGARPVGRQGGQGDVFELRAGEVLGLAGLMGSGCSELVEALFGLRLITAGEVHLEGQAAASEGATRRDPVRAGLRAR